MEREQGDFMPLEPYFIPPSQHYGDGDSKYFVYRGADSSGPSVGVNSNIDVANSSGVGHCTSSNDNSPYSYFKGDCHTNNTAGSVNYPNSTISNGKSNSASSSESGSIPRNNNCNMPTDSNNEGVFLTPTMGSSLTGQLQNSQASAYADYSYRPQPPYDIPNSQADSNLTIPAYLNGSNPQHDQYRFQVYRELFHDFNPDYCDFTFPEATKNNTSHIDLSNSESFSIFNTVSSNESPTYASPTSITTLSPIHKSTQASSTLATSSEPSEHCFSSEESRKMTSTTHEHHRQKSSRMLALSKVVHSTFQRIKLSPLESKLDLPMHQIPNVPVWKPDFVKAFTFDFLLKARSIKLYYIYAIDRATSTLVMGMAEKFQYAKASESKQLCYNEEDLKVLKGKGFMIYGALITYLRRSILKMSLQYPLKVSFLATYSSLGQRQSSMLTFQLMQTGTMALINKQLEIAHSIEMVSGSTLRLISMLMGMAGTCLIPDYSIDILHPILRDLEIFINSIDKLAQNGYPLSALDRGILNHDCTRLRSFLNSLLSERYPAIHNINENYKHKYGIEDTSPNIYFTSPTLMFDIATDWLYLSLAIFNRSFGDSILKMIAFLFHFVVGRVLSNCLTPISSIHLLDFMNIFCVLDYLSKDLLKVYLERMNLKFYPGHIVLDESENYVMSLFRKLMRIDQLMSSRLVMYRIQLRDQTIPQVPYLRTVARQSESPDTKYGDIVGFTIPKLSSSEIMLNDLGHDIPITEKNLPYVPNGKISNPQFPIEWLQGDHSVFIINRDTSFIYTEGLYWDDVDPRPLIESMYSPYDTQYCLSLQELKDRAKEFQTSRDVVAKVLH